MREWARREMKKKLCVANRETKERGEEERESGRARALMCRRFVQEFLSIFVSRTRAREDTGTKVATRQKTAERKF